MPTGARVWSTAGSSSKDCFYTKTRPRQNTVMPGCCAGILWLLLRWHLVVQSMLTTFPPSQWRCKRGTAVDRQLVAGGPYGLIGFFVFVLRSRQMLVVCLPSLLMSSTAAGDNG